MKLFLLKKFLAYARSAQSITLSGTYVGVRDPIEVFTHPEYFEMPFFNLNSPIGWLVRDRLQIIAYLVFSLVYQYIVSSVIG